MGRDFRPVGPALDFYKRYFTIKIDTASKKPNNERNKMKVALRVYEGQDQLTSDVQDLCRKVNPDHDTLSVICLFQDVHKTRRNGEPYVHERFKNAKLLIAFEDDTPISYCYVHSGPHNNKYRAYGTSVNVAYRGKGLAHFMHRYVVENLGWPQVVSLGESTKPNTVFCLFKPKSEYDWKYNLFHIVE